MEVDVSIDLATAVQSLSKQVEALRNSRQRETYLPRYGRDPKTTVTDSSGGGLIKWGPVPLGSRWVVRKIIIGGVTWATSVSGSASFFQLPEWGQGPDTAVPLVNMEDQASGSTPALPSVATYGHGEMVIWPGNCLWAQIVGGSHTTTYTGMVLYVIEPFDGIVRV